MADIPDLQAEILSRTLTLLRGQIPDPLHAEIAQLAASGQLFNNGALHAVIAKAAIEQSNHAD